MRHPKLVAEVFGTFCLVFFGCGAAASVRVGGTIGAVGVALAFGLIVLAMVYALGHISGAHINPAVTLGFWASGRMSAAEVGRYAAAQLAGAALAAVLLLLFFPAGAVKAALTVPSIVPLKAVALEFVLTAVLMFVVLAVAIDNRAQGVMAGVAIGAVIAVEALVAGGLTGASMNPARSFGPALALWSFQSHWIYWIGPLGGAFAGARLYRLVRCEPAPVAAREARVGCC